MDASTEIDVGLDTHGRTVVRRMRCEPPLLVRAIDDDGPALHLALVNGAAGPLGGDHLCLRLVVGAGASVVVGSVAATMVQPGPRGERSTSTIELVVGDDAFLEWAPQPTVSVAGSDHRTMMRLVAAATSSVRMQDVVSLGRHGEPAGRLALRQRVTIAGAAVLDHETVFGCPALAGPGAHGTGRTMTSVVTIGAALGSTAPVVSATCAHATLQVSPTCTLALTTSP